MWLNYNRFLFESEIDRTIYVYISNKSSSKTGEFVNIIWKSNGLNNWITRVRNFILIEIPKFEINWIDKFSKWNYVEWISIPLFNRSRCNRNRNNWSKKKRKKKKQNWRKRERLIKVITKFLISPRYYFLHGYSNIIFELIARTTTTTTSIPLSWTLLSSE